MRAHTNPQPSMLTWPIIGRGLTYILRGKLRVKAGHLPPDNHLIPHDFIGVCVASAADASMDGYVISQLRALGVQHVRLDFTYGDLEGFNARFLGRLIAEDFKVTLHIIQPFAHASRMEDPEEQVHWQRFLSAVLDQFGAALVRIEVGTTINRKRWAGYTVTGFLQTWEIAHAAAKQHDVQLAGPNVTDFEPIYNIGILSILQAKRQLPDVHTNNLFSERVSEPERFDHRIFKYRWATRLKFNLIKKARILKKISTDFGVPHFVSPVAFWAIYRIQRLLPDGEQKQADYAARYMLLNAASGALDQAFWGALICQREGLINDGLTEDEYPALERVTHYANVDGQQQNFRRHASFNALKMVATLVQGAHYQRALATADGLEIHHFQTQTHDVHALWTINGKAAWIQNIYAADAIAQAEVRHRDGQLIQRLPDLVTETPMYLYWPKHHAPAPKAGLRLAKDLAIHAHIHGLHYYVYQQDGWQGLILAESAEQAACLAQALCPEHLVAPQKEAALRHARNAIWSVPDPRDVTKKLTVKQPIKMYPHKAFLDRFKPSKAKRSWNGAMELLRRGVATAYPVAFFENVHDKSLKQNFYICEYVAADCSVGEMFIHFSQGHNTFYFKRQNVTVSAVDTYKQLAAYLHQMHKNGAYFRDLSGGNILVEWRADHQLHFSLIDTARAWFFNHPTALEYRISDLARICNKLHWAGREQFLAMYLAPSGRKLNCALKRHFYVYDTKVALKRKFGRKGIKRLCRWLKLAR